MPVKFWFGRTIARRNKSAKRPKFGPMLHGLEQCLRYVRSRVWNRVCARFATGENCVVCISIWSIRLSNIKSLLLYSYISIYDHLNKNSFFTCTFLEDSVCESLHDFFYIIYYFKCSVILYLSSNYTAFCFFRLQNI